MTSGIDFGQWKWDLAGLAAAFAIATGQKVWRSYQEKRSEAWPISYGHILVASAEEKNKKSVLTLDYSYRVSGEVHTGSFKKIFDDLAEAQTWAEALSHKQVAVRYDAEHPTHSQLREVDLEPMVRAAAPFQVLTVQEGEGMAGWQRVLFRVAFVLALAGLAGVVVQLAEGIVGKSLLPARAASVLNTGAYAVFAFTGLLNWSRGKQPAKAAPEWMKYLGYALFYYIVFSVAFIPGHSSRRDQHPGTPASQERDFNDVRFQLFFYFGALEWCYASLQGDGHEDDLNSRLQAGTHLG